MRANNCQEIKYDVFISFRGEDTRQTITSHLHKELCRKNIVTYKDDIKLARGEEISPTLFTAIQRSKIAVVIFSEMYASSRWCLEELVHILECKKQFGQQVVPVFYHVDPSHLRCQEGTYATDLANFVTSFKDRVNIWKVALTEVANLAGFHYFQNSCTESDLVDKIAKDICKKLKQTSSNYAKGLIGIEHRFYQVESILYMNDSHDVRIVGIWGMGGIGKTTIAKAIFDRFSNRFDGCCFLENVREELEKFGVNQLRTTLFSELLQEENVNVGTSYTRSTFGRGRLCLGKYLIVLDDLNLLNQFKLLIGNTSDFKPGTRIIVTSRDLHVLRNLTEENNIYKVEELTSIEALQLFQLHAFKKNLPPIMYNELSNRVVDKTKGLPLALTILGLTLYSKSVEEWKEELDKMEVISNNQIHGALRISYDGLDDPDKRIFLDIACFFKGWDRQSVVHILSSCGVFPTIGMRNLVDKSLIRIGGNNTLQMHDLLQELGQMIVREESILDPRKRSRLWDCNDVLQVLENNVGTEMVEGIFYENETDCWIRRSSRHYCKETHLDGRCFSKMTHLRLLKISNSCGENCCKCKLYFPNGICSFPSAPSLFHWNECPLKILPSDFMANNLVQLVIPNSQLKQLWTGVQPIPNLKMLYAKGSKLLTEIPDLSLAPNLDCINLEYCTSLVQLPSNLKNVKSLFDLNLNGCSRLETLPELPEHIKWLDVSYTAIQELPKSIEGLHLLRGLHLQQCHRFQSLPSVIHRLKSLTSLKLSHCSELETTGLSDYVDLRWTGIKELPSSIGKLTALQFLFIEECKNLEFIPESIYNINGLINLSLPGCSKLEKLPCLPDGLKILDISRCSGLKSIASLPRLQLRACDCYSLECVPSLKFILAQGLFELSWVCDTMSYDFGNCLKLDHNATHMKSNIDDATPLIIMGMANKKVPQEDLYDGDHELMKIRFCFPGSEIPEWFKHQARGSSIDIELPPNWLNSDFLGFVFSFVLDSTNMSYRSVSDIGNVHFICRAHFDSHSYIDRDRDRDRGRGRLKRCNTYVAGHWPWSEIKLRCHHLFISYVKRRYTYYPKSDRVSFEIYTEKTLGMGDRVEGWKMEKVGVHLLYKRDAKKEMMGAAVYK